MCQDLASATYDIYELKSQTFKNGKPEEFLQMMKDFKTATDGTGTTYATRKIQFLCTMFHGGDLIEYGVLASQFGSTTNGHLKLTKDGLIGYFPPLNALNKQKRAMRYAMRKPRDILFKIFSARPT